MNTVNSRPERCGHSPPPDDDRDWLGQPKSRSRSGKRRATRYHFRCTVGKARSASPRLMFGEAESKPLRADPQYDQLVFRIRTQLKAKFDLLADCWERETRNMSSPNAAERHPAYAQIVGMGKPVIPWILRRLAEYPAFWFRALSAITQEPDDPVEPWMYGDLDAMSDAWLRWGEEHGYIGRTEDRSI